MENKKREYISRWEKTKRFFSLNHYLKQNQTCEMDSSADDFSDKGSIDTHRNARSRIHAVWVHSNARSIITCSAWQFLQAANC